MKATKEQIKEITEMINSATYSVIWSGGSWAQKDIDEMEYKVDQVNLTVNQVAAAIEKISQNEFEFDSDDVPIEHKIALWIGRDAAYAIMSRVRWSERNQAGIWAPESARVKMEI